MVPDMEAFDTFLRTELVHMPGVDRVNTTFALKAVKQATPLPLDRPSTSSKPPPKAAG